MTAENSSDPPKGQDSSTHVHSTGPSQAPTSLARTRHSRHWVGDLVRLMVGLTALISAISHLVSVIGG